ncbi:MAG TPA: low affinity iron permease family protein [Nannocystaceae bacterium]|nr:low affinity iron permease family protein [Nannocystaceae bacterium]
MRSPAKLWESVSKHVVEQTGRPWAFGVALGLIVVWVVTGPIFGFSDTWQLVINTGTTIITFLMVFLIQHAQNKDSKAMELKLDELIRAMRGASNRMMAIEELTDEELAELRHRHDQHVQHRGRKHG